MTQSDPPSVDFSRRHSMTNYGRMLRGSAMIIMESL